MTRFVPYGDGDGEHGDTAWRERIIAHMLPLDGLAAPAEQYLDAICANEHERTRQARDIARMSSCALLVRATWAQLGVSHPILAAPYRIGAAVSDVITIARARGALRSSAAMPRPGDVVIIDGPAHVLTVVHVTGSVVHSIDGGQGPGGRAIGARVRAWTPGVLGGRPVLHLVDADRLALAWGVS